MTATTATWLQEKASYVCMIIHRITDETPWVIAWFNDDDQQKLEVYVAERNFNHHYKETRLIRGEEQWREFYSRIQSNCNQLNKRR